MTAQIFIALFGLTAVYLTQQSNEHIKRYASIFGLLGQPFWIYATYTTGQWGMLFLTACYTYAWLVGFYNSWLKRKSLK